MSKKKEKHYYELDEATVTADIRGYLANKKQVCDPFSSTKKKKKKDEKPWYLATMKDLHESIRRHLSVIKEAVGMEDLMKAQSTLKKHGLSLNNYHFKNAVKMLQRAHDKKLPPEERKPYIEFAKHLKSEYNNNLAAYVLDMVEKAKNVTFGELKQRNPELAEKVKRTIAHDFPRLVGWDVENPKLSDSFNDWHRLPDELRSAVQKVASQGETQLKTHSGNRPYSDKGKMKVKAKTKKVSPSPRFSPGEIAQKQREIKGKSVSDIQGELEREDPATPPGAAVSDLRNVYAKLADEILYGKGGHYDELVDAKVREWEKRGVDLKDVLAKYLQLQSEVSDDEEGDELTPALQQAFDKEELAALMDFSDSSDPEKFAQRARPAGVEKHTEEEKALDPFVRGFFKDKDGEEVDHGKYEDSGFVTDEALLTFAKLMGVTKGFADDQKNWADDYLINLRNKDPKRYKRVKGAIIKRMKKAGLSDAARREAEMDLARSSSEESDLPTRYKVQDPELGLGKFSNDDGGEDETLSALDRLVQRRQAGEFGDEDREKSSKALAQIDDEKPEKREPKVVYGSKGSEERHKKSEFDLFKRAMKKQAKKERDPRKARRDIEKKRKKPSEKPRYKKPEQGVTKSVMPKQKRQKLPKKPQPQKRPSGGPLSDLTWGDLPVHLQNTILSRFKRMGSQVSPNWSRFETLPPAIQKYIASELKLAAESYYPKIKLEMLFNIDGSEETEKPRKKKWEDATLAKDIDFTPRREE